MRTLDLEYVKTLQDPLLTKLAEKGFFFYSKFEFILTVAVLVTFVAWLLYKLVIRPQINNYRLDPGGIIARSFAILHSLFLFVLLAFVIYFYGFDLTNSAEQNLEPDIKRGNSLFVYRSAYRVKTPVKRKILYKVTNPERGDYIKYYLPHFAGSHKLGRVVGLPNETVEIDLEQRTFRINQQQREFYFSIGQLPKSGLRSVKWRIPENTVLVLPNFINESVYLSMLNRESNKALSIYYQQSRLVKIKDIIGKIVYVW